MRLLPSALRLAWHARTLWHLVTRPLTVGVRVIIERDGAVLLVRHSYIDGWHMPGGGVGKGETLAQAALREVREEVGIETAVDPQPFGVYARFRWGSSDHVAVFVAHDIAGTPVADGVEVLEARFFAFEDLPPETTPATLRRLHEYRGLRSRAERW